MPRSVLCFVRLCVCALCVLLVCNVCVCGVCVGVCRCWCWCVTLNHPPSSPPTSPSLLPSPPTHPSLRVYVQLPPPPRVYIQNVPVCTGTSPASVTTCGSGAGTHGDVVNVHTGFQRATPHRTHTPRPQRHTQHNTASAHNITRRQGQREREKGRQDKTRRQEMMKEERHQTREEKGEERR